MSPTPISNPIHLIPLSEYIQKNHPYCPLDTIVISGTLSLIVVVGVLFFVLFLLKKLFHWHITNAKLFLTITFVVMILSLIKHVLLYGIDLPWYPFPLWITPIDCL